MDDNDTTTAVGAAMAALAIIAVGLRFYTRYSKKAGFKWDDWLILAGLLCMIATDIVVICANIANPTGAEAASGVTDTHEYTPEDVIYTQFSFIATVLYFALTATTKLSILLLYSRLFSVNASFRRQIVFLSTAVICYWFGCTVADLLNCIPMKYTWINSLADPRYCINYNIYWFATGVCEASLDLLILLMPIGVVVRLQLSTGKKIAVGSVFLVGVMVILSGLLKTIYGYVPNSRQPSFSRTSLWTTVHSGTGIICACLPVCWPVFASLGNAKRWSWINRMKAGEYLQSFSGWSKSRSRARPKSALRSSSDRPDTSAREYELSLRTDAMRPFEGGLGTLRLDDQAHYAPSESFESEMRSTAEHV